MHALFKYNCKFYQNVVFSQELGHDPGLWMLQMDHNRQVHILPRTHTESDMEQAATAKVSKIIHIQRAPEKDV
jgi:hypothetical protein